MKFVLSGVKVFEDKKGSFTSPKNILVNDGIIEEISSKSINGIKKVYPLEGMVITSGWVDLKISGFEFTGEENEDLSSLSSALKNGGFVHGVIHPSQQSIIQSKDQFANLNSNGNQIIDFSMLAGATLDLKGERLTEMRDLYENGAKGFSDGGAVLKNNAVLERILIYLKQFNSRLFLYCYDEALGHNGLIHEGKTSTELGLPGIPSISEYIDVQKVISLAEYVSGSIHICNVSTKETLNMIKKAKKKGVDISCDVAFYNLINIDEKLVELNTNDKVIPPYRSKEDRKALINGVKEGVIDCISSNHVPRTLEYKNCEFDQAAFGMSSVDYCVSALLESGIPLSVILPAITSNPLKVLNLPIAKIEKGAKASFTILDIEADWVLEEKDLNSKSKNSPFLGKKMKGKVQGIVNNGQIHIK